MAEDRSSTPSDSSEQDNAELEDLELDQGEGEITERVRGGRRAISIP